MNKVFFDIETVGLSDEDLLLAELVAEKNPPANMSKPESIEKWREEKAPRLVKKSTSLDGTYGKIVSIAWAVNGSKISNCTGRSEEIILRQFFSNVEEKWDYYPISLVGHNLQFDIRFLIKRCIILGVYLPSWIPSKLGRYSHHIFDTMLEWDSDKDKMISQTRLAKALGIEVDESVDGSMIGDMYRDGKFDEIAAYNRDDVRISREIHGRMTKAFENVS